MKKILMLITVLISFTIAGCSWNMQNNMSPTNETGSLQSSGEVNISGNASETPGTNVINYSGELMVAGIGPDESFESTVDKDTFVLKRTFEDHSDHVFFPRQTWSNYLDIQDDLIPGNHVKFVGTVKALDAAAGNHYYEVVSINELTKVSVVSKEEVEALIQRYSYCEQDSDCVGIYGKCPLGCHIAINGKFQTTVEKIIDNFWNNQESQCTYKCMEIGKIVCNAKSMCEVK